METADPVEQLIAWRKREGLSYAKAGQRLGVSGPTVLDWERRRKRPRDENRDVIEAVIGTDPKSWRTEEERAAVQRVMGQLPVPRAKRRRPPPKRTTATAQPRAAAS